MKSPNLKTFMVVISVVVCACALLAADRPSDRKDEGRRGPDAPPEMAMEPNGPGHAPCKRNMDGPLRTPPGMEGRVEMMADIEIDNPSLAEELKNLKNSNPDAFHDKMREAMKEIRAKKEAEAKEFMTLVEQYKQSPGADLKAKVRAWLVAQFDRKIKMEELMVSKQEERTAKMKEDIRKQKEKKEQMVNWKLTDILMDPAYRW